MSNKVFSGDFLKVLLALKESIMKDIHCSELAIIKEVYSNNCNCSLLSNPEIKINAYKTRGTICRVGDIVLVAFNDNDFRSNLLKKDNNSQLQIIDSPIKHQLDYGIIISNLTIGLGGTNVKFIDNAINITNLSNLDLNRLSDQKLNELKDSDLLTENALYMTPDVSEDDTKANVDASNLSDANITSWKNKCGFEKIETVYDMNSTDPNINWGYISGIGSGNTFTSKDFTKYKKLIGTYGDSGNVQWVVITDLSIPSTQKYSGTNSVSRIDNSVNNQMLSRFAELSISLDKTSLTTYSGFSFNGNANFVQSYKLCKLEGVY